MKATKKSGAPDSKKRSSVAMNATIDGNGGFQYLLLKVTPPRVPRHLISRARLRFSSSALRDYAAFLVQAPAGFGKTSLLAQWRREYLALGVVVAWVSAQVGDDPRRLVQALALAVRVAAGRPVFGHGLLEAGAARGLGNITVFLTELAQTALNVVLIIDEADQLPAASSEALAYLLRNAPANLRVIVAARTDCTWVSTIWWTTASARSLAPRRCVFVLKRRSNWCASDAAQGPTATRPPRCMNSPKVGLWGCSWR